LSDMKEAKQEVVAQIATSNNNGIVDFLYTAQGFQPLFIQGMYSEHTFKF